VAPLAVITALPPAQYDTGLGFIVTVGTGFTVTVTVAVLVQPFNAVPVTVYVVVAVGEATGLAQVVQLSPVEGAQLYVFAPLAVSVTLLPAHIVAGLGLMVIVGLGRTVTVTVVDAVHPAPLVPITV
jgi:hypothetical protein